MTTALTLTLIAALLACWRLTRPEPTIYHVAVQMGHNADTTPQPEWVLHEALVDVRPWAYLDSDGRVRRATHKEVVPMMGLLRPGRSE